MSWVLAVNPGAGSTKVALYQGESLAAQESLRHSEAEIGRLQRIADELPLRLQAVRDFVARVLPADQRLAAVVGRGGLLGPVAAGTYRVDDAMVAELARGERGHHASNLGAPLALAMARERGCPAFVVDPVSVDELEPVARLSGLGGVARRSFSHALNMRAVARRHAKELGQPLAELRLVVAHLGTGVSLSAQRGGRMVDVVNPQDEGPFSGDRSGGLPLTAVVEMCFTPGSDERTVKRRLFGDGGLYSHLGTRDVREAIARAEAGDAKAGLVLDGMTYQIAKSIGALAAALEGEVDAILITGGMAHLPEVVDPVVRRVAWIAPVKTYPGEDELRALAEGALRVLAGAEPALVYRAQVP